MLESYFKAHLEICVLRPFFRSPGHFPMEPVNYSHLLLSMQSTNNKIVSL